MMNEQGALAYHPLNLAIRLLLEVAALVALGMWGWSLADGLPRYALALSIPSIAATMWGVFAVPGDKSRSGKAPVPIPGIIRLALEAAFFGFATFALFAVVAEPLAAAFGVAVLAHYALSYDRVRWLIGQ